MKRILNFFAVWLWIGFSGGAAVLLLIATPIEKRMADAAVAHTIINISLSFVAFLWVVSSGWLAHVLAKRLTTVRALVLTHAVGVLLASIVFGIFLQAGAGLFARFRGETQAVSDRFTFGPYPDLEAMKKLKSERYTAVITLLSPMVPFEAVLLSRERDDAAIAGLELIEASMLPWVSSNEESLSTIRELAESGEGRYYVHCYLGRHRADLAKFVIHEATGARRPELIANLPPRFTRGRVYRIGEKIAAGPLPTRDEWFEHIVRSGIRRVAVIVDSSSAEPGWLAEERAWAAPAGIDVQPFSGAADDVTARVVAFVGAASTPAYIHSYLNDRSVRAVCAALDPERNYLERRANPVPAIAGLPPVSGAALSLPARFERGAITRIDERIAVGPLPTRDEWEGALLGSGVRLVISMLNPEVPDDRPLIDEERKFCAEAGIGFLLVPARWKLDVMPILGAVRSIEGNIYVHGFAAEERIEWVRELLAASLPLPGKFERGGVITVGTISYGPLPTSEEWMEHIARSGITTAVAVFDRTDPDNDQWIDQIEHDAELTGVKVVYAAASKDVIDAVARFPKERIYIFAFRHSDPVIIAARRSISGQ